MAAQNRRALSNARNRDAGNAAPHKHEAERAPGERGPRADSTVAAPAPSAPRASSSKPAKKRKSKGARK